MVFISELLANPIARTFKVNPDKIMPSHLKFDYKNAWTTFIGRTEELDKLNNFLANDAKFLWWVITGDGGAGKSRLAEQFRKHVNEDGDYFCEFPPISVTSIPENQWVIDKNTLFIIDYAARFADVLLNRITDFTTKSDLKHKVRILLIEREVDGKWWEKFNHSYEPNSTMHEPIPLEINSLSGHNLVTIVKEVINKEGHEINKTDEDIFFLLGQLDGDFGARDHLNTEIEVI